MFAQILLDEVHGEDRLWTYGVPPELQEKIQEGVRVWVPFGFRKKRTEAFVIELKDECDVPHEKLKWVEKIADKFVALKPEALAVAPMIADRFKLRLIDVIRLFVPATVRGRKRERKIANKELRSLDITKKEIILSKEQQSAVDEICSGVALAPVFVLHGVTGSGKTEVYMNVIERVLAAGKSAIMLVPEIGLTPQMMGNFKARFGDCVAMIHSGLTPAEKYDEWVSLHRGEKRIVIGARSAVFAPVENVGVIIIDEEHDTSYFSESNPRFSTHEVARIRAQFNNCPVVLGSATPSLETMYTCRGDLWSPAGETGRPQVAPTQILRLSSRVNNLQMPTISIVDMVAEIRGGHGGIISRDLLAALRESIEAGKQALVFLNRRGFSSYVGCLECGWVGKCDNCDVSLVWHAVDAQLKCHYCSARYSRATKCKECSSTLLRYGQVGTQKLVEELQKMMPNVPIFRLDTDVATRRGDIVDTLQEFANTPGAILVGTQMIAKGHDFPEVAVVGIVDADNALHFSDYRAAERTFALITQVAGRAGRATRGGDMGLDGQVTGRVYLQTYKPKNYVYNLVAKYDFETFLKKEMNLRQVTAFPPFTTIVRVLVTGTDEIAVRKFMQPLMKDLRTREKDMVYLGAMKAPLGRVQNKFRYQILMRFKKESERELVDWVHDVVKKHPVATGAGAAPLHVFLEINPQNLS